MNKILVCRFSALGDVAISVHVIKGFLSQNSNSEIVLLTKPPFRQLFKNIDRVTCFDVDLKKRHKGIFGIKKLCNEIVKLHEIEFYADIHDVIRSNLISFFLPSKIKKAKIDKGRKEKKQLTRKKNKKLHQLKHSAERYAEVFRKLGFNIDLFNQPTNFEIPLVTNFDFLNKNHLPLIGIAPFAKHESKTYPIEKIKEVVRELSKKNQVIIFGGGEIEKKIAEKWVKEFQNLISVIGKFSMLEEIALMDNCNIIITMDSGNMHLASLTKTKIISIWGATHPFLGFYPLNKPDSVFIQKELSCRPCSVFGNKKCYKRTYECLDIDPKIIIDTIQENIK